MPNNGIPGLILRAILSLVAIVPLLDSTRDKHLDRLAVSTDVLAPSWPVPFWHHLRFSHAVSTKRDTQGIKTDILHHFVRSTQPTEVCKKAWHLENWHKCLHVCFDCFHTCGVEERKDSRYWDEANSILRYWRLIHLWRLWTHCPHLGFSHKARVIQKK